MRRHDSSSASDSHQPIDVSVVIVNYNTRDLTSECLASLPDAAVSTRIEVIVVDNASADGSAQHFHASFPNVAVLESGRNGGFGWACNLGAAAASGRWILLLNSDTVAKPGVIDELVKLARQRPRALIYGGRTLSPDGALDPRSCWGSPTLWSTFCYGVGLSTAFKDNRFFDPESLGRWPRDSVREVGIVTGCLLMIDKASWDILGGFDERFFMYGEDADLNFRVRALGGSPVITPTAQVTHVYGASSVNRIGKLELLFTGKSLLFRKMWPGRRGELAVALLRLGVGVRAALRLVRHPGGAAEDPLVQLWRRRAQWSAGVWPEWVQKARDTTLHAPTWLGDA